VVPASFDGYFTAAAAAAGVLIGLLFVAVSLRPDTIFGEQASPAGLAQAGSAFTCLVNCFFVSLVALIPTTSLGVVCIILALSSLLATTRLHREVARHELQLWLLVISLATYLYQLIVGILLLVRTGYGQDFNVAYLQIGFFAIALRRAWSLVQGKHLSRAPSGTPAAAVDPVRDGGAGS
jgi:hypothetical protein